ncbi:dihydroorotate dehydrogenase [Brevibacterium sp. CFH 10365]|uniref:dihydroorotate dehydrogenase n=1 Tax=Brevibacterium sp. CFH 10365 TaxID=2585207 RepID=UPI00126615CE|nr:dihydroorotate dehydrogenase [Brevibacterium sp. CFH 10365]
MMSATAVSAPPAPVVDLGVDLGGVHLRNPVMPASGCFGPELAGVIDVDGLGAMVTKTVFDQQRAGNPAHRLTETAHGMLNSVGIPSPGSAGFRSGLLRDYQTFGTRLIVSIGGLYTDEYYDIAGALADETVDAFELNISCPNLEHDGLPIGASPERAHEVITGVKAILDKPLFIKLTPTVASIAEIAAACEDAGADAVVVSNSYPGLAIDIASRTSVLGNGAGGYTGPAVKPLALKLVHDAAAAVSIPVIGCGGIGTAEDVLEFLIAGAGAVQVGTATFTRPTAMNNIISKLPTVCERYGITALDEVIGSLEMPH